MSSTIKKGDWVVNRHNEIAMLVLVVHGNSSECTWEDPVTDQIQIAIFDNSDLIALYDSEADTDLLDILLDQAKKWQLHLN